MTMGHLLILDTSCLLAEPLFFLDYDLLPAYVVLITKPVLEELDALKIDEGQTGYSAREASRQLEQLLTTRGWNPLPNCKVVINEEIEQMIVEGSSELPPPRTYDDRILAIAGFCKELLKKEDVWLVTLDRNMRIRAQARDIGTLDPSGWWEIADNVWSMPMLHRGLRWHKKKPSAYVIPVDLGDMGEGRIEVWPYYGYESGLFSTVHIRLFEPGSNGQDDKASNVLVLSTTPRIPYRNQMITNGLSYQVMVARPDISTSIYHKCWKLDIQVKRCEVLEQPIQFQDKTSQAIRDIVIGIGYRGAAGKALIGHGVGTLIATYRDKASILPAFAKLGLRLSLSKASLEEPAAVEETPASEQLQVTRKSKATAEETPPQSRQRQNTWVISAVALVVIYGLGLLSCCWLYFLLWLLSLHAQ
jgi:hypothetical protein